MATKKSAKRPTPQIPFADLVELIKEDLRPSADVGDNGKYLDAYAKAICGKSVAALQKMFASAGRERPTFSRVIDAAFACRYGMKYHTFRRAKAAGTTYEVRGDTHPRYLEDLKRYAAAR